MSTLAFRGDLQGHEQLEWVERPGDDADDGAAVVHFRRPHGWEVVMNFGTEPVDLPEGELLVGSGPLEGGRLPGETAVWLRR